MWYTEMWIESLKGSSMLQQVDMSQNSNRFLFLTRNTVGFVACHREDGGLSLMPDFRAGARHPNIP